MSWRLLNRQKLNLASAVSRLVWMLAGLGVLMACSESPMPALRIATNVWPGYEPLYLARSLGKYDDSIRLVEMASSSQSMHALSNGTVEAAALTLDEALTVLEDNGDSLRIILVMDFSNGADSLLAHDNIHRGIDLRGKRVGVENTATGALLLDAALKEAGLSSHDINLVPLNINDHLHAWTNREVDALVSFEPVRSQLLSLGGNEIFDSSRIPGRILDVLVVRSDAIHRYRQNLTNLVAGYFAALDYLQHNPADASLRMAPRLKSQPDRVMALFAGIKQLGLTENNQLLNAEPPALHHRARELADLMRQHQLLLSEIVVDHLADGRFLPDAPP